MIKIKEGSIILTQDEYDELNNPDKCYTFLTKTKAKNLVTRLLKSANEKCWNDTGEDYDDGCCSYCTVYTVLGREAADVICTRQKRWSK